MRIGLISDTHGDGAAMRKTVKQAGPVELWLHAGDHARDAEYLHDLTGMPFYAASGNCDPRSADPPDQFIQLEGWHIMLTHGHRYQVKHGLRELIWWAKQYEANVVIFGHTHKPVVEQGAGLMIINPGSPSMPRGGSIASFGILELSSTGMNPVIVELI